MGGFLKSVTVIQKIPLPSYFGDDGSYLGAKFDCTNVEVDWPSSGRDGFVFTNANTVVNAYVFRALLAFADIAEVLGHDKDAASSRAFARRVQASLNELNYDESHLPRRIVRGYKSFCMARECVCICIWRCRCFAQK